MLVNVETFHSTLKRVCGTTLIGTGNLENDWCHKHRANYYGYIMETNNNFRSIFQGNIVVPTGNPFDQKNISEFEDNISEKDPNHEKNGSMLWLGPGLKILLDHVLAISEEGIISWIAPSSESGRLLQRYQCGETNLENATTTFIKLSSPSEFLCPGMIDLHIHAPQFAYTGTATDLPLTGPDGWLERYTFPAESRLRDDLALADQIYRGVVTSTLRSGTTTAVYFGTLHLQPNKILADACLHLGQRALIGKVCMDRNSPDHYVQSLEENLQETVTLIEYIREHPKNQITKTSTAPNMEPLVLPLIVPRFIPTCSPKLLTALGDMAAKHQCHVTSHISESIDEVAWSKALDLQDHGLERSDAEIFHAHNLLTNRCIMAHGVHLSDDDTKLLRQQKSAIAHCPLSNFFFAGGVCPCRDLMVKGNRVGLGTDVAGGYSPSMMHSARTAVLASQSLHSQQQQQQQQQQHSQEDSSNIENSSASILDYRDAFYLATLGGAEALGFQDKIGTFQVGMDFDAIILSADTMGSIVSIFPDHDEIADIFQKLWVLGDDRNVKSVFVQGREVKGSLI